MENDKNSIARKNILRKGQEIQGIPIKGYDFDEGVNYEKIIESYLSTGAQASNLGKAI